MSFQKVADAEFLKGEHDMLRFWNERGIFDKLRAQNANGEPWSFLDGPITANNPMGVHHAWGRTYKDAFQRFQAMQGKALRFQNGFDCQGLWVEVEVQKELGLATKHDIERFGMDRFVNECKRRVLRFAARQTEQSIRLGYWMDWDRPDELRKLAEALGHDLGDGGSGEAGERGAGRLTGEDRSVPLSLGRGARGEGSDGGSIASFTSTSASYSKGKQAADAAGQPLTPVPSPQGEGGLVSYQTASGETVRDLAHRIVERLGNRNWGGSYFTFSTENNETIWTFLKKCHQRGKIARGHDVMP
nr:class I tRNA ligase family protein [Planctomycetota bacterium]